MQSVAELARNFSWGRIQNHFIRWAGAGGWSSMREKILLDGWWLKAGAGAV